MITTRAHQKGNYLYDVNIYTGPPAKFRFRAQVVNMVRLEAGRPVAINPGLQDEFGATGAEAFAKIEAVIERWVKDQTRSY